MEAGEDDTIGKVVGAELRRPSSGTTKQWWIKIQWSDDPEGKNLTMCKERDVIQFIARKAEELDSGEDTALTSVADESGGARPVGRPRRSKANYGKTLVNTLLVGIFTAAARLESNAQDSHVPGNFDAMALDYDTMRRRIPATATHALMDDDWFLWYKAFQAEHNGWIDGQVEGQAAG